MSLTDYLAMNYLTADTNTNNSKKRKRTYKPTTSGLSIADDDLTGWDSLPGGHFNGAVDENGIVAGQTSEFRKAKSSKWKSLGAPTPSNSDQTAADAILVFAADEESARRAADEGDDAPQIVHDEGAEAQMATGAAAGLQSAAAVTAQMERKKAEERSKYEADPASSGMGQETIYRDASGRMINVAMKRAEARKAADAEEKKKLEQVELLEGDVQKEERAKRRQDVKDAKYLSVARYADDVGMNEQLKDRDRWNDPAAQFLTKKQGKKSSTGKPLFKGSSAPNRYGIKPGYRWDGVDRSNGWEKEWFQKRNQIQSIKDLKYQWEMDE